MDSIREEYDRTVSKIDAQTDKLNQSIDSLQRLELPTERYTKRVDRLKTLRQTTESKLTSRLNALKAKTTDKLNTLDLPPSTRTP